MSRIRLLTSMLLGCLVLSGCGLFEEDQGPGPEATAEELVEALASLTLDGVTLAAPAASEDPPMATLEELAAPLADFAVTVDLLEVRENLPDEGAEDGEGTEGADGDESGSGSDAGSAAPERASALLGWSWSLEGQFWDYESSATLVRTADSGDWQVEWAPTMLHPDLAVGDTISFTQPTPVRGRVLGAGGQPIVVDRPVKRYGIDKSKVTPEEAVAGARKIADLFDVDRSSYVDKVKAYGPAAFVEALVLRSDDAVEQVPASYAEIPGATVIDDQLPLAPTRDFATELLGRVGPATAEIIDGSQGRVRAGDEVGLSGLQARYDSQLFGTRGITISAVPEEGEPRVLHERDPAAGADLKTTLDPALQERAESLLDGFPDTASALVAIQPSTGHVLAAANGPGSDLNGATFGQFAPGSTFKIATALALLRSGTKPGDMVSCPTTTVVDGRTFKNYDDYPSAQLGRITLRTAFAHSCNTAMINAREAIPSGRLAAAAASLGLGVDHDLGFPAYFGQVPEAESETERGASMIGQGRVLASPMAVAAVAASVAARRTVLPVLLPDQPATESTAEPLSPAEADQLRDLTGAVVTQGSGRGLADVPGVIGAKTGTAEFGEPGPSGELPTHAWMIAFRDDLAVAVFVERGDSGSGTAGPIIEAFLKG